MTESSRIDEGLDVDLLEHVLVSAADVQGLIRVADAIEGLVAGGAIRLIDVVGLVRAEHEPGVRVLEPDDNEALRLLTTYAEGGPLLSRHDIDLAAVTLAPGMAALLLLVEDRWASTLARAARDAGGRMSAGERVARDRVLTALEERRATGRRGPNLLVRGPLAALPRSTPPLVDPVAQVHKLAHLVERGLLSLEQYEVQRRRVLEP